MQKATISPQVLRFWLEFHNLDNPGPKSYVEFCIHFLKKKKIIHCAHSEGRLGAAAGWRCSLTAELMEMKLSNILFVKCKIQRTVVNLLAARPHRLVDLHEFPLTAGTSRFQTWKMEEECGVTGLRRVALPRRCTGNGVRNTFRYKWQVNVSW